MSGADPEPAFLRQQRVSIGGETTQFGIEQHWRAPGAIYHAAAGFDEDVWFDEMPDDVLAWTLGGGAVVSAWGPAAGSRINGPGRVTLQAKTSPNHSYCRSSITFAHFLITPPLLAHVASELRGAASQISRLRDDLTCIEDAVLFGHLTGYVGQIYASPSRLEMESRAILIVERLLSEHHGLRAVRSPVSSDWRLRRATDYLEARLADDVGLAEVSALVGLSGSHLTALFRKGFGEAPHRWLMRRRFERACELLRTTRLSITEVSCACGFSSSQHMSTAFQRRIGITPGQWRGTMRS